MRKLIAGGAAALLIGLATAFAVASDEEIKSNPGNLEGAIVRTFKDAKLLEYKIEKVVKGEKSDKTIEPRTEDDKKSGVKPTELREGMVIYVHVPDATRVFDKNGKGLTREDKGSWFSRDKGWSALDEGKRCRIEFSGTHDMPAPRDFPSDARAGGNIIVYEATNIYLLTD